jgi:adenylate cyclase
VTTVVFADLVGSTSMYESLGDATASQFVTQLTTQLSHTFAAHQGRVVKLLGDGLFVVFARESHALAACVAIQQQLQTQPIHPGGNMSAAPVQMQFGVETGDVVEIDGDCFGDAVNSAARLADLAGGAQILTTLRVYDALPRALRQQLISMGPLFLRGKADATEVFRVQWRAGTDNEATVMGVSMHSVARAGRLSLHFTPAKLPNSQSVDPALSPQSVVLDSPQASAQLGRALQPASTFGTAQQIHIHDARVSRLHCSVEWRGTHWIVSDASSYGTWVYLGNESNPVVLRRGECQLIGSGHISLGCERGADAAPVVRFELSNDA